MLSARPVTACHCEVDLAEVVVSAAVRALCPPLHTAALGWGAVPMHGHAWGWRAGPRLRGEFGMGGLFVFSYLPNRSFLPGGLADVRFLLGVII